MASSDQANATNKIIVKGLPSNLNSDKLIIHFQRKKLVGGGDVNSVTFPKSKHEIDTAIIEFDDPATVRSVLQHQHNIGGKLVTVSEYSSKSIFEATTTQISPFAISEIKNKYPDFEDKLRDVEDSTGTKISSTNDAYAIEGEWHQVQAAFDRISCIVEDGKGGSDPIGYFSRFSGEGASNPTKTSPQKQVHAIMFDKDQFAYLELMHKEDLEKLKKEFTVDYHVEEIGDAVKVKVNGPFPLKEEEAVKSLEKFYKEITESVHQVDFKLDSKVEDHIKMADEVIAILQPEFPEVHIGRMHGDENVLLFIATTTEKCAIAKDQFKYHFDNKKKTKPKAGTPAGERNENDTIEVDYDVFMFMELEQGDHLKQIWKKNGVKIQRKKIGDCLEIKLRPLAGTSTFLPKEAMTAFQRLYENANENVALEEYETGTEIDDKLMEKSLKDTRKIMKTTHIDYKREDGKVLFMAKDKQTCKVAVASFKTLLEANSNN